ncbi:MgtC/SapB family protein [Niabella ginsengisoli]|uniref:MgtC/SapB family protein n=1 Tax=Niabella ginsengisoli TaxID=522298 RepID=A0ABS9SM51_9BACT|nr:MgtC/SapB family protein [Niabella ginsengisoli]MCH5599458.1 MgtC/SapB family protein [Niabella ginsengisoli]
MFEYWEITDLYKALISLGAGIVLGLERELKDKAAGLKTITLICIGSCLFSILSIKIGNEYTDAARIASYIVSGIGFLGAGVIFKDGITVSGLTTASVIWVAAAVGMAVGFGEVWLAITFLCLALLMTYFGSWFNKIFPSAKLSRLLMICIDKDLASHRDEIIQGIGRFASKFEERKFKVKDEKVYIFLDVTIRTKKLLQLEDYLIGKEEIIEFEL